MRRIVGRAQLEDCRSFCEFESESDMKVDIADDRYFSNIFVDLELVFQNLRRLVAFWRGKRQRGDQAGLLV